MAVLSVPSGGASGDLSAVQRQVRALQSSIQSIQTQTNTAPGLFSNIGGKLALGVPPGSVNAVRLPDGSISLDVADSSGFGNPLVIGSQAPSSSNYIAPQTHAGAPTTTQFPSDGNFGWYKNTTSGNWYFTLNFGGSLVFQNLATFSGTISDTQHGSRSGGTLHAAATTSAAGFATAAQITLLGGLNTTVTDITTTGAVTELLNGSQLQVNGTKVVGARNTGWSQTGTFTTTKGLVVNTTSITAAQLGDIVYTIYTALVTHGLLGT